MMISIDQIDPATMGRASVRQPVNLLPDPVLSELWCPIISADDHVVEPPSLFLDRLPSRFRDDCPQVVYQDDDLPFWRIDGDLVPLRVSDGASGRPIEEWNFAPAKYSDFRRGVYDVDERVRDMDLNGVYASLNFPSFTFGFAGKRINRLRDRELGLACVRAYNDWMLDDWCGRHRERFIPCQLTWFGDVEVAAAEIRRNADRGFTSVSFSENPEGLGYPNVYSTYWDPFFAACEETGTVINLHVGSSGSVQRPTASSPAEACVALFPLNGIAAAVDWVFAKVPLRFGGLKIALSEAGVSWVPMVIERLRRAYRMRGASIAWATRDGDPVEVLLEHFYFTSIEDPSAFRCLDSIGTDHVMLESDYPHSDSSWPDTQQLAKASLQHLDPSTVQKICFGNAAALYRHPLPPAAWLDASTIGARTDPPVGGEA